MFVNEKPQQLNTMLHMKSASQNRLASGLSSEFEKLHNQQN